MNYGPASRLWTVTQFGFLFLLAAVSVSRGQQITAAAQAQIQALEDEKAARTPAQQKLDSNLLYRVKKNRGEALPAALTAMTARVRVATDGFETVDLSATVTPALLAEIRRVGGTIVSSVPRFQAIRARLPLAAVEALASRSDVQFIRPAVQAMTHVGAATSQGDTTHRAATVRSSLLATGRGVKVGVLSDSVDHLSASQASGDLGPVTILPGQDLPGNAGEGTAMLEIVHDLAPDAELFFATAFISEAQFAQNILDLRSAGCDIIVDDVGYFDESPLQDGPVAQAVNQIVADGGLYFSAAGNEGNKNDGTSGTWEGDFADGGPSSSPITKAGRLHSFGATNYNNLTTVGSGATLFWADPLGAARNDYDLYVLDAAGTTVLAASTNVQNGHQDPYEAAATSTAGSRIVIVKATSAQPRFLHLNTLRGRLAVSTDGCIQGHPAAAGALAVAATDATKSFPNPFVGGTTNPVETFSTDGHRRVFFAEDGTPLTPGNFSATGGLLRPKPELTAADGVATSLGSPFSPFYGTSAAAPHAAAIAALVWSRNRNLTPQQVRTALTSNTLDIEATGADRDSGAGVVNALAAVQSVPGGVIATPISSAITGESFSPANNQLDPGETLTLALALRNDGAVAASNLNVTLLAQNGVSAPSAPQSYGALVPTATATRSFSFQGNGAAGTSVTATFLFNDGTQSLGTYTLTFPIGTFGTAVGSNNVAAITIPTSGVATPYPSAITIAGFTGTLGKVTVTLNRFSHTYPSDLDILLVSPSGRKVILMSDAGGSTAVTNLNLTFDDAASGTLGSPLTTGTFKTTALESLANSLPTPAPAAPYQNTLGTFNGDTANGSWQLYVRDQFTPDSGSIATGWTLRLTPVNSLNGGAGPDLTPTLAQSVNALSIGDSVTYTATIYNNGPAAATGVVLTDNLPANLTLAGTTTTLGTVATTGNALTVNVGTLASGQTVTVKIVAVGAAAGLAGNTVNVTAQNAENSTANNSASTSLTVGQPNLSPVQPIGWDDALIISTTPGTTTNATAITANDPVFLDLAFANSGNTAAAAYFVSQLTVDGAIRRTFERQLPFAPGSTDLETDLALGSFSPGQHTITLTLDAFGAVPESSEADNIVTRTFQVGGPNLTPFQAEGASDKIVVSTVTGTTIDSPSINSGQPVFVDFGALNAGNLVTGSASTATLYLDGNITAQLTIPASLAPNQSVSTLDQALGAQTAGLHTLRLVVDPGNLVAETSEADNEYVKTFVVNSLPTLSALAPQNILEDGDTGSLAFSIGDAETASANLMVTATSSNPTLLPENGIFLAGSGVDRTILLTPAADRNGSGQITISVADGNGGLVSSSFVVNVAPVNDPPSFVAGPNQIIPEDAGAQVRPNWATAILAGPSDESGQNLQFQLDLDQPGLFSVAPTVSASGTLSFTPAPNASGIALVTVTLQDSGRGRDTSPTQTFSITLVPENDAPTFALQGDQRAANDAGPQSVPAFATKISAGAPDEASQALSFQVTVDRPDFFLTPPDISSAGTLTYTPAPYASGTALVTVRLFDDGRLTGNALLSAPQTFHLAITTYAEETGRYTGLALPAPGVTPGLDKAGLLKLTLSRQGRFTGLLRLGRQNFPLRGRFDRAGVAHFGRDDTASVLLARPGLPTLRLDLQLDVGGNSDRLTGTINENTALFAFLQADRALYTNRPNPPDPYRAVPADLLGAYTLLFIPQTPAAVGLAVTNFPQGDGTARLTIKPSGSVRLIGRLATGQAISSGNPLSKLNTWPLWDRFNHKKGMIAGLLTFRDVPTVSDLDGANLLWFREAGQRRKPYPLGWPQGLTVDVVGSKYTPFRDNTFPALAPRATQGNASVVFQSGDLAPLTLSVALNIATTEQINVLAPNSSRLRFRLSNRSGYFRGSLVLPDGSERRRFQGIFLQKQFLGSGYFSTDNSVGSVHFTPEIIP